ncbi:MAG: hypothetical protein P8M72_06650 [Gammaproteobacteria bacterium]|nr:hypothetical protein [Gammaproteobacteria bacterium]
MLEILMNPGDMTQAHWMIIGILFLLILGVVFFVYRTYLVIKDSAKKTYKPNIGLSRLKESDQAADEKTNN